MKIFSVISFISGHLYVGKFGKDMHSANIYDTSVLISPIFKLLLLGVYSGN